MTDRPLPPDEIFNEVVDLAPAARAARLDELCGGDGALRAEVASLLAAWLASGDFLAHPADLGTAGLAADAVDAAAAVDSLAGQLVGGWRLHRLLGSGGMGDVWLADRDVAGAEQTVAVKIIRASILAPDAMRRFRNECRVLAGLDHPGIARLIEGGVTDAGVPYLVVEHVDGRPLDAWCDAHGLDARARVGLLIRVCEAVRHLHRHSVIHRDLKPANVLVDAEGRPRLIDFGIARALDAVEDEAELTLPGLERMTPAYASPEQLRGEPLSLASDVYSLGVLAYRVLTGRLPHAGRRRWELEREITTTAPRRPSDAATLAPVPSGQLRGDLDTIVLAALRTDPERRYPSAEALREDLERYLDGRPVLARGDSFGYVAGKFVRRHAAAVALALVAVLALAGAAVTGFTLYAQAEAARRDAVRDRTTAERVSGFLDGLLAAVDPMSSGARTDLTVRQTLDEAAARLERELDGEPDVAAALHLTIGNAYVNLGLFDQGDRHLQAARALYAGGVAAGPDRLAAVAVRQADLALKRGDLAAVDSLLVPAWVATPGPLQAGAYLNLSRLRAEQSRLDEAAAAAQEAVTQADGGRDPDPVLQIQSRAQLGTVFYRQGSYAAAESLMAEARRRSLDALGDAHALSAECAQNLGAVRTALGRPADAATAFTEALAIYERVYPPDHPEFAVTLNNLAETESAVGRHAEALGHYEQARGIVARSLGRDHVNWGLITNGAAFCRWRLGQHAAADTLYREAIGVMAAALDAGHPWTAVTRTNLARLCLERDRPGEAAALARQALGDLEAAFPAGHVYTARPLTVLAELALAAGDMTNAAALIARADTLTVAQPPGGADRR
ncbi:MAG: serine/threonine protein kinase, partial [Krumholzibacteria bacterium]|nr:serine/threonine protein kinase [Candidatus Krumholzibacteria bacterium]